MTTTDDATRDAAIETLIFDFMYEHEHPTTTDIAEWITRYPEVREELLTHYAMCAGDVYPEMREWLDAEVNAALDTEGERT